MIFNIIPVKERLLSYYATVFHEQAFFIFGGRKWSNGDYYDLSGIGRLDAITRKWSVAGYLKNARNGHAVVFDGIQFLVIGGDGYQKTENCVPNGDTITCTEQKLELGYYTDYPELMLVDEDYGDDC